MAQPWRTEQSSHRTVVGPAAQASGSDSPEDRRERTAKWMPGALADDDECMTSEDPDSPDPVARSIDAANDLLDQRVPDREMVSRLIEFLESFQPRELVRFDEQGRSYYSGIRWSQVRRLRGGGEPDGERRSMRDRLVQRGEPGAAPSDASGELWDALALVSGTAISESMRPASRGFGH